MVNRINESRHFEWNVFELHCHMNDCTVTKVSSSMCLLWVICIQWNTLEGISFQFLGRMKEATGNHQEISKLLQGSTDPNRPMRSQAVRTRTEKFSYRSVDPWAFVRYFLPVPHVCWSSRKHELHSPTSRTVMSDCFGPGVGIIIEIMFLFWMSYFWKNWDTFRFALQ